MTLELKVTGLDRVIAAIDKFPREIRKYMVAAGKESASHILNTQGLRRYPPAGSGNVPPTPYYIRGVGTQYATKNLHNSERYGTRFYVEPTAYGVTVGNSASYAKWLGGEEQAKHMAAIGWRKLVEVAEEKLTDVTAVYQKWIDRLIRDLGL